MLWGSTNITGLVLVVVLLPLLVLVLLAPLLLLLLLLLLVVCVDTRDRHGILLRVVSVPL